MPEPPDHTCISKTNYLQYKTKISKENKSLSELLLFGEYITEGNVPCFPLPGPSQLYTKFFQQIDARF